MEESVTPFLCPICGNSVFDIYETQEVLDYECSVFVREHETGKELVVKSDTDEAAILSRSQKTLVCSVCFFAQDVEEILG